MAGETMMAWLVEAYGHDRRRASAMPCGELSRAVATCERAGAAWHHAFILRRIDGAWYRVEHAYEHPEGLRALGRTSMFLCLEAGDAGTDATPGRREVGP